ncbi:protein RIC-3 isoform X1 [Lagopus leucura]|uniref:protein RIC-3 isoform X1 n=1 Tax=Lagopus leucura TaxID=30410 RepID=UPI001C6829E0|nr:protein RIC-3 isoform X1 [Lagopus leucura]XP_042738046.1 protein RIC-3 isoform X1 [Lagopus leucura]
MAPSTCRRVAAVSCLVLCVSLLLPRTFLSRGGGGRQEPGAAPLAAPAPPEGKLGRFPPRMHYQAAPDSRAAPPFPRSHLAEAVAKAKGGGGGGSAGGAGRGLVGQIIPIYGFGIFLYILYILFKLASKGKTTPGERKCLPAAPGNMKRKINIMWLADVHPGEPDGWIASLPAFPHPCRVTCHQSHADYELTQLQEKLRETEEAMEKLINRVGPNCDRAQNVTTDQEKRLLQQLREITRVMKEGKFIDGISPEKEAEEAPYMEDWEGYPEETYPIYDNSDCFKRKQDTILVDYPDLSQPSAEELAERMEGMEDEEYLCNEALLSDLTMGRDSYDSRQKKDEVAGISEGEKDLQRSQNTEECCYCYEEEDDPAIIAEYAVFHSGSSSEAEEATPEDLFMEFENENAAVKKQKASDSDETGTLRKRYTKGLE